MGKYNDIVRRLVAIKQNTDRSVIVNPGEREALEQSLIWPDKFDQLYGALKQFDPSVLGALKLPDDETEQKVARDGLSVLSNAQLAALVLNRLALCSLQQRIQEELPDYWLKQMWEWAEKQKAG